MGKDRRILRKGRVARCVVAVIGADHDVGDGLVGDLRDGVHQPLGFLEVALAVGLWAADHGVTDRS